MSEPHLIELTDKAGPMSVKTDAIVAIVTPDFPQRAYWDNSPVVGALIFLNTGVTFYVTDTVEDVRVKCSEEVF